MWPLRSPHLICQQAVIQYLEPKDMRFHFLEASFHHFPTVTFPDFQSPFRYPNGLIFTIQDKKRLFSPC
ncbi:hypothetical protein E5355_19105 [Bacteroides muris (ex Afrizal et al. 2022)]|uniref:Uncharacterized protein n=1 Tax=Bacteroides muris (ex Afrizal et al. 2022) TaxID=2516960 RepID=A0A4S2A9H5_9BACE|nr:hypothetical protein E5355_19105 [Bacteroides muris (ex Afrizal et al. 2022)]